MKEDTLRSWYRGTWPQVYRRVYGWVQNREEAEDIAQEVYVRALRRPNGRCPPPALAYLQTIALNLVRDRWRRLRSWQVTPLEEWMLLDDADGDGGDSLWLRELLDRLPEDQRTVLDLRIVQGYSREETARHLGRSEASVRGLQYRAVRQLRAWAQEVLEEGASGEAGRGSAK